MHLNHISHQVVEGFVFNEEMGNLAFINAFNIWKP